MLWVVHPGARLGRNGAKYHGATVITPDVCEAVLASNHKIAGDDNLIAGATTEQATYPAEWAAGIVVGQVSTAAVTLDTLQSAII